MRLSIFGEEQKPIYDNLPLGKVLKLVLVVFGSFYFGFIYYEKIYNPTNDYSMTDQKIDLETTDQSLHQNFNLTNQLFLNDYNFLPVYELRLKDSSQNDIFYENKIDYSVLQKYIQFQVRTFMTENNKTEQNIVEFRNCRKSDFEKNGYQKDISFDVGSLLCPDVEKLQDSYMLKNKYEQRMNRGGFSLDIIKCNPKLVDDCKRDSKIDDFLSKLIVTKYLVTEELDFHNHEKYHGRPVRQKFQYNSQFSLNSQSYRDVNNFMRLNLIKTKDSALNFAKAQYYKFLEVNKGESWIGMKTIRGGQISYEGQDEEDIDRHVLASAYYFNSDDLNYHERKVYQITRLLSEVGGMSRILQICIHIVAIHVSKWFLMGSILQQLFYVYKDSHDHIGHIEKNSCAQKTIRFKFSYWDHLWQTGWCSPVLNVLKCGKKQHSAQLFHFLYHQLQEELDIVKTMTERKKLNALVVSMFEQSKDKQHILEHANTLYEQEMIYNVANNQYKDSHKHIVGHNITEKIGIIQIEQKRKVKLQTAIVNYTKNSMAHSSNDILGKINNLKKMRQENNAPQILAEDIEQQKSGRVHKEQKQHEDCKSHINASKESKGKHQFQDIFKLKTLDAPTVGEQASSIDYYSSISGEFDEKTVTPRKESSKVCQ